MAPKPRDLVGLEVGRLTVLRVERKVGYYRYWRCQCSCGVEVVVLQSNLTRRNPQVTSCGCYRREMQSGRASRHGLCDTPRWRLWQGAVKRSKAKGLPCTLTPTDIPEIPTHCPILGIELTPGKEKPGPNSPSLDRIVPALGYIPGNVQVISLKANVIKNDATVEELEAVARYMRNLQKKD